MTLLILFVLVIVIVLLERCMNKIDRLKERVSDIELELSIQKRQKKKEEPINNEVGIWKKN